MSIQTQRRDTQVAIHCDSKAFGRVSVTLERAVFKRLVAYHNRISEGGPIRVLSRVFNMVARYAHLFSPAPLPASLPAPLPALVLADSTAEHPPAGHITLG